MWEKAIEAIQASSKSSSVYVGCDSVRYKKDGNFHARYATVVIVHKDSSKGAQVFHDVKTERDYGEGDNGVKLRMLNEVGYAIKAAEVIAPYLNDRKLEIHLDLNKDPKHKSNLAVKEAIGWVLGMGYTPKIKPEGWAATHAADHCARGKSFAG